ncbi:MAG TPA: ABC transporter ATP-binding protein [Coriobacteriia bacterium]|jgi:ABC-type lipoprotein export system ATPase subunit
MPELLVCGEHVAKTYGERGHETHALAEASFEIRAGERVALVGPSGSGKTTLLHLIAGIDVPSAGTLEWPALGRREELRPGPVAMAFQGPSLLPPLTVAENVALPLLLAEVPEAEATERAWELLDAMGLTELAEKLPEELSGGQAQRVGLARALVSRPVLLLADEPTGQLDHEHAQRLMDLLLARVHETGAALVIATHDDLIAERLDERWAMLDGRMVAEVTHA